MPREPSALDAFSMCVDRVLVAIKNHHVNAWHMCVGIEQTVLHLVCFAYIASRLCESIEQCEIGARRCARCWCTRSGCAPNSSLLLDGMGESVGGGSLDVWEAHAAL